MLRITERQNASGWSNFILEGKLTAPWIPALKQAALSACARGAPVYLDLSGLRFADSAGIALLQKLASQGVSLRNASPFVQALFTAGPES